MPQTIGLTILCALFSAAIILVSRLSTGLHLYNLATKFVGGPDFKTTLLDGMLSFLLFAGTFQSRLRDMRDGRWPDPRARHDRDDLLDFSRGARPEGVIWWKCVKPLRFLKSSFISISGVSGGSLAGQIAS